jgi:aryl-alcohol dehydrogenase-like predicted oxidoreductase
MEQRSLGSSGVSVSVVGLGCNNLGRRIDKARAREVVDAALDVGVTFLDTARSYGDGDSERFLGEILEGRRGRAVLATKFAGFREETQGLRKGSREYVRRAAHESLERLRTEYLDVLYVHDPDNLDGPLEETWGFVRELVDEGLVRAAAVSNVTAEQLRGLDGVAAVQNEYSLLDRAAEADVLPLCAARGIGFVPYFPLASGLLTGKYRRGEPAPEGTRLAGRELPDRWDELERLDAFARERGRSLLELAVGALASQPGVASVIAGATRADQVRENAAAGAWRLPPEDLASLSTLLEVPATPPGSP